MSKNALARFYHRFVKEGDLVFDIGAYIGEHTDAFLELGCKVVAVEPQANLLFWIDPRAHRVCGCLSSEPGAATLFTNGALSSLYPNLSPLGLNGVKHGSVPVTLFTLDQLIEWFGIPAFVKIDVEGHELHVLQGLSQPLPALSFEVHRNRPDKLTACVKRLEQLGIYHYDYSPRTEYAPQPLADLPGGADGLAEWGDVYATLVAQ